MLLYITYSYPNKIQKLSLDRAIMVIDPCKTIETQVYTFCCVYSVYIESLYEKIMQVKYNHTACRESDE